MNIDYKKWAPFLASYFTHLDRTAPTMYGFFPELAEKGDYEDFNINDQEKHIADLKDLNISKEYHDFFLILITLLKKFEAESNDRFHPGKESDIYGDELEILEFFKKIYSLKSDQTIKSLDITVKIHNEGAVFNDKERMSLKSNYWAKYLTGIMLDRIRQESNDFNSNGVRNRVEKIPIDKGGNPRKPEYVKIIARELDSFMKDNLTFKYKYNHAEAGLKILQICNLNLPPIDPSTKKRQEEYSEPLNEWQSLVNQAE